MTARTIQLSTGEFVNPINCCEQLSAALTPLEGQHVFIDNDNEKKELNDQEKDLRKCLLVVATQLSTILEDKAARRRLIETLQKPLLIALTRSDWLVLEREEDWYKFCRAWAKYRVRKALGIPEPSYETNKLNASTAETPKGMARFCPLPSLSSLSSLTIFAAPLSRSLALSRSPPPLNSHSSLFHCFAFI